MAVQIQLRRDTAANWTSVNPTLAQGEAGLETDTGKLKLGDGTTAWASLAYFAPGLTVQDEGTPLSTAATTMNFVGAGVTATGTGATKTITIPGAGTATITTQDEGSTLSTGVTTLNFVGAGVTASGAGATTAITIPGGAPMQYPGLKPNTPTDDFNGASLSGWSVRSGTGTFVAGDIITQAVDGSHVDMEFSGQMGSIYRSHSNTDLDIAVGGLGVNFLWTGNNYMVGIYAVDASGNGMACLRYNDGSAYLATLSGWAYSAGTVNMGAYGFTSPGQFAQLPFWARLTRTTNTWQAYLSFSGRAWDITSSTTSATFTIASVGFGMLYANGSTYNGRIFADWFNVAA